MNPVLPDGVYVWPEGPLGADASWRLWVEQGVSQPERWIGTMWIPVLDVEAPADEMARFRRGVAESARPAPAADTCGNCGGSGGGDGYPCTACGGRGVR